MHFRVTADEKRIILAAALTVCGHVLLPVCYRKDERVCSETANIALQLPVTLSAVIVALTIKTAHSPTPTCEPYMHTTI
jgi:hypothetical protein